MLVVLELRARCWQECAALQQSVSLWLSSNTQPTVTPLQDKESKWSNPMHETKECSFFVVIIYSDPANDKFCKFHTYCPIRRA